MNLVKIAVIAGLLLAVGAPVVSLTGAILDLKAAATEAAQRR